MTLSDVKNVVSYETQRVSKVAEQSNLFYVICFWISPITEAVEHRCGYFEDISEACLFASHMEDTYSKFNHKYYIASNTGTDSFDGGLFNLERRTKS